MGGMRHERIMAGGQFFFFVFFYRNMDENVSE
jgi:hypothetical protein